MMVAEWFENDIALTGTVTDVNDTGWKQEQLPGGIDVANPYLKNDGDDDDIDDKEEFDDEEEEFDDNEFDDGFEEEEEEEEEEEKDFDEDDFDEEEELEESETPADDYANSSSDSYGDSDDDF